MKWCVAVAAIVVLLPAGAQAQSPTVTPVDAPYQVTGLSCPTPTQCTLVDYRGNGPAAEVTWDPTSPGKRVTAVISQQPNLVGVACPTTTQCTAGAGSQVVTFNPVAPGTPTPASIGNSIFVVDIACPSTGQCTALGNSGNVATFNPTAPANPTAATIDSNPGHMQKLVCPSTTQCTASDGMGNVVTFNPNAPGTPAPVSLSHSQMGALACPTLTQCTAVDQDQPCGCSHRYTFNPASPGAPSAIPITASSTLDCPSTTQCTVANGFGQSTFDPTNALAPPVASLGQSHPWLQLRCPAVHECVAVSGTGDAVTFDPVPPVPPAATPRTLSLAPGKKATVIVVVPTAKEGTKVAAKLTRAGRSLKKSTLKVKADHSFTWKLGRLKAGTYVARFTIAGKVVKSTTIKVKRRA